jgi:hypothetical protein
MLTSILGLKNMRANLRRGGNLIRTIWQHIWAFLVRWWSYDWVRFIVGHVSISIIMVLLAGHFFNTSMLGSKFIFTAIGAYAVGLGGMHLAIELTKKTKGKEKYLYGIIILVISSQLGKIIVQNMLRMFPHDIEFYSIGFYSGLVGYFVTSAVFKRRPTRR